MAEWRVSGRTRCSPYDRKRSITSKALSLDTVYEIECVNSTEESYHFVCYVAHPFERVDTVAWQVVGVPRKGAIPSRSRLLWRLECGVAIAFWDKTDEKYCVCQTIDARPGIIYEVAMSEEGCDIPVLSESKRKAAPGMLWLMNATKEPLDLGFTISGKLVVVERVMGGEVFMYNMPYAYWVLCVRNRSMKEGQVLNTSMALGPVEVQFDNGYTKCKVEASNDSGKYTLKGPEFCT